MKLRIRYRKITKTYEINDERKDDLTVAVAKEEICQLFRTEVGQNGEIQLSLNKNDILEDEAKLVADCKMVSGDLVHIVTPGSDEEPVQPENNTVGVSPDKQNGIPDKPRTLHCQDPQSSNSGSTCLSASCSDVAMATSSSSTLTTSGEEEFVLANEEPVDHAVVRQCLSEPVLCREASDGQVPALLREVYGSLQPQTMTEALGVILHVLMLETGFLVRDKDDASNTGHLPGTWRCSAYLKFSYTFPGCGDKQCSMMVVPTGNSVSIHGTVVGTQEATRNCSLPVKSYVRSLQPDCAACYCDLAKLSRLFKDSIANPLVQDCRTAAGLIDVFGLLALTQEVKLRILSFLDLRSLLQVSRVHSQLHDLCKDRYIWRRLYLSDFGNRRDNTFSQDWKQLYTREYRCRKERRKMMSRMTMVAPPLFTNPQNPFSGPSHWIPPGQGGIIGGDYDLYPNFPGSLPGVPGRLGPIPIRPPRPRYDLIGPGVDPGLEPSFLPRRAGPGGRPGRGGGFYGGVGPRFF